MSEVNGVRYATSGDVSVAYQVIGNGPRDLIYVQGIISHVEFFHQLPGYTDFLQGLASFARVIVFDKRGNGLSDRLAGSICACRSSGLVVERTAGLLAL